MQASEAIVRKVLEGGKQFLVPHYQRPYSWGAQQWADLWSDLQELVDDPDSKPHFIGSIVSAPARSIPEGVEKRLLIDGQQRLTTLVVLLSLLRARAQEAGDGKLADRIGDLITNRHEEGPDHYKVLPTQGASVDHSDRDAFAALLAGRPITSESRIRDAAAFFTHRLQRNDAPSLESLFLVVTAKLTLVSIILDDNDNPHRIFESLNGKGRPLSQADLIRNYFFMRLPEARHEHAFAKVWQPMQQLLGEEVLPEFIRHYLMIQGGIVKSADTYMVLKARVDASGDPMGELDELARYARFYDRLLRPDNESSPTLRERLTRLARLQVTVAYPLLLGLLADVAAGKISEAELGDVLDTIETYMVRRFVCRVPTHGLNKVFAPLYAHAANADNFVAACKRVLSQRDCPNDSRFRDELMRTSLYGAGERRERAKFVLDRLERALGHKEVVNLATTSIEHVMPQSLSEWWQAHLGDDWQDDHDQWLHTLGNLTLTGYNAELSNDSFPEKQVLFAASHIALNRHFVDVTSWNAEAIMQRAESLADVALSIWPSFGVHAESAARDNGDSDEGAIDGSAERSRVTGTLPRSVHFRDEVHAVKSWAEVLVVTFECVIRAVPEAFGLAEAAIPRMLSRDEARRLRMRRPRRLSNGAFVETNVSAAGIERTCRKVLVAVGLGDDAWSVDCVSLAPVDDEPEDRQLGELGAKQLEFWLAARTGFIATGAFGSLPKPRAQNWFDVALGRRDYWLSATVLFARGEVAIKLMTVADDAGERLALWHSERASIEGIIGAALEWDPHPEKRMRSIRLRHAAPLDDTASWAAAIAWLTETAGRFKQAFGDRILAIN